MPIIYDFALVKWTAIAYLQSIGTRDRFFLICAWKRHPIETMWTNAPDYFFEPISYN